MNFKHLFIQEATSQSHFQAQQDEYAHYTSTLLLLVSQGVDLSSATKARILAACWARRDHEIGDYLLDNKHWGLPEVLKALKFLDANRKIRMLQKKLERLEKQGCKKAYKMGQLKSTINDLSQEAIGSLSGALARRIRRWIRQIPEERLEHYTLSFPAEPWKELADMLHLNPKDFQSDWFLGVAFGEAPPKDNKVSKAFQCDEWGLLDLVRNNAVPYTYIRRHFKNLSDEVKAAISSYEAFDIILWYYEELACEAVDKAIEKRLQNGEEPQFGYGKLVERMLVFQAKDASFFQALIPIAQKRLKQLRLPLESPVVVLGDASSSMDVAIRVSTIIGSLLTALTGADLRFFNQDYLPTPTVPRDVNGVLEVVEKVRARGSTSPAAALWPSYHKKELVRHFIVVTDEEENTQCNARGFHLAPKIDANGKPLRYRFFFAELLKKYRKEVFPAKVAFVSFLKNTSKKGQMVTELEAEGIPVLEFRMDGKRPDLTKVDALLGLLSSESAFFLEQADSLADTIRHHDFQTGLTWLAESQQEGGQQMVLRNQIIALRDLALSRQDDQQLFLERLSRLRHLAKSCEYGELVEEAQEFIKQIAVLKANKRLPAKLYRDLIARSEVWELQLEA